MTTQELRDAVNAQPFRPFKVHLAGGRSFTVKHPEFISVAEGIRTFVFSDRETRSHRIIDLLHAEELEFVLPDDLPDPPLPPEERPAGAI